MRLIVLAMATWLAAMGSAPADEWPSRPLTLVVPYAAGGPTDTLARNIADSMGADLGQRVIVENVVGASGALAVQRVMNAEPDGYTIGIAATATHATGPQIAPVKYDPRKDFTAISLLATHVMTIVVKADSPLRGIADLIALARASPGQVTYGDPGNGTMTQLSARLLESMADLKMVPVGYRGAAPALVDLIAGRIGFYVDVLGSPAEFVKAGQLRMLATTGASRTTLFPDVPAVAETLPGYEIKSWYGLLGPKGLPPAIVERLNRSIRAGVRAPKMVQFLSIVGYEATVSTPAEFQATIERDYTRWGEILASMKR